MRLRQIEIFHAFMITGSTVSAAEYLNITQPAVSTALKRLEDELNLQLFKNVQGRLSPTPESHTLFRQVCGVYEEVSQLKRLAKSLSAGETGYIRYGTVPAISETVSATAIAKLRKYSRNLSISLEVLNTHELVHRLQTDRLDIACIFGDPSDTPLEIHKAYEVPLQCIAPTQWVEGKSEISLEEMAKFPMVTLRTTDPIGQLIQKKYNEIDLNPDHIFELRSCRAAMAIARASIAVCFADTFSIKENSLDSISNILTLPMISIHALIVSKQGHALTKAETNFINSLSQSIEKTLKC